MGVAVAKGMWMVRRWLGGCLRFYMIVIGKKLEKEMKLLDILVITFF